jgi:hypothetical protein
VELPADTLTKSRLISETQSMSMPSMRATDALAAWEKNDRLTTNKIEIQNAT